jgi:outer membrane murein-binding lipoprotein Lpp
MTLGLHDTRSRRRRGVQWFFMKAFLAVLFVLVLGLFAYEGGSMLARLDVVRLEDQVVDLNDSVNSLEARNSELQAAAEAAQARAAGWQDRYEREVPNGPSKALFEQVQDRLTAGVEPERLAFLIRAASAKKACDGVPSTKRFLVKTPLYQGANDAVSFAQNTLTVTAEGATSTDANGNRENWFDSAQAVTLRFTTVGGETSVASGILPLHYSVVLGDSEHRFSVLAGDTGFVKITGTRCAFP